MEGTGPKTKRYGPRQKLMTLPIMGFEKYTARNGYTSSPSAAAAFPYNLFAPQNTRLF